MRHLRNNIVTNCVASSLYNRGGPLLWGLEKAWHFAILAPVAARYIFYYSGKIATLILQLMLIYRSNMSRLLPEGVCHQSYNITSY
jgi:hypothetical protein